MHDVILSYNPYARRTYLNIDGIERKESSRRIDTFITGKDINMWLSPFVDSYRRWNGFVPELMDELNDDELRISFLGTSEDYKKVVRAIEEQKKIAEGCGYSSENLSIAYKERYSPEIIQMILQRYVSVWYSRAKLQLSLNLLSITEQDLATTKPLSIKKMQSIYDSLRNVLMSELESVPDDDPARKRVWEKAQKDMEQAFRGETIQ